MPTTPPRFAQIVTGPWEGDRGLNHTLYGLDTEGLVWRYSQGDGWRLVPWQGRGAATQQGDERSPF